MITQLCEYTKTTRLSKNKLKASAMMDLNTYFTDEKYSNLSINQSVS